MTKDQLRAEFISLCSEEDGQDMVEYALLLAFVALAAVAVLAGVRSSISKIWTSVNTTLTTAATS
jgi:Flp pilus assembly pilin Flp